MRTLYTRVKLVQLRCHDRPDGWTNSEPYIWTIFFKIDGSCITLSEKFRLEGRPVYHFSKGSQGNLNAKDVASGGTVQIPEDVGEWKTMLVPIKVPFFEADVSGVLGMVSVLMEQNLVSSGGAEAGHDAFNRYVTEALDTVVREFDPKRVNLDDVDGSIKAYFDKQVTKYTENISSLVSQAVSGSQNIVQNFLSLLKKDAVIGHKIWDFSTQALLESNGEMTFTHRWDTQKCGDWEIKGKVYVKQDSDAINALKHKRVKEEEEE
jgi:hypothetical protein